MCQYYHAKELKFYVSFLELGLTDGHSVVVADVTTPKPLTVMVKFVYDME